MQYVHQDLLDADIDIIVQQTNCLTVRAHGLSESISKKYPYANPYKNRKSLDRKNLTIESDRSVPGTIEWFGSDKGPLVCCIYGQYQPGKCTSFYGNAYPFPPGCKIRETSTMRLEWFKSGLKILLENIRSMFGNQLVTIGFPYKIGCGLAGGLWSDYEKALQDFSKSVPNNICIRIYKLDI